MSKYRLRFSLSLSALALILIYGAALTGCESILEDPNYLTADGLPDYNQADFDTYLQDSQRWLRANRVFNSADEDKEITANLPYEIKPENSNGQGVLLVHAFADSPLASHFITWADLSMDLPTQQISNGSHLGLLFSPQNPVYGRDGEIMICGNGQTTLDEAKCQAGEKVWYSAYGYQETGKIHARLTWNPYFAESMSLLDNVMQQSVSQSPAILAEQFVKPLTLRM